MAAGGAVEGVRGGNGGEVVEGVVDDELMGITGD